MPYRIVSLAALFLAYSFLGWIIESSYKTISRRRGFVNSGLLSGPVVPIYGFGAMGIMLVDDATRGLVFPLRIFVLALLCAALEYIVGWLFETVFKTRLWDYTDRRFNIRGRVCLSFTLAWAALATVFIYFVRPFFERIAGELLGFAWMPWLLGAAYAAFLADAAFSFRSLALTSSFIAKLRARLEPFDLDELRSSAHGMKRRLLSAFPNLLKSVSDTIGQDLARRLHEEGGDWFLKALRAMREGTPESEALDPDYLSAVGDILLDEKVQSMGAIRHHDGSLLVHSLTVSLASYYIARGLGYDAVSVARGALLHDFFLYDWRTARGTGHRTRHPGIALENATARFKLNAMEKDIILSHMWPAAKPFYSYKESFLVSTVDKIVSTKEVAKILKELMPQGVKA
jgi:uncharacterized membrane protein